MRLVLLSLLCFMSARAADSTNYVDSDWAGTQSGTAAAPWSNLTASAWATINSALSNGNVTVYFSARAVGADTNQFYSAGTSTIDLVQRQTNQANRLTLDGRSFWNSSDSVPSWSAYTGSSRCQVKNFTSTTTTHIKHSDVTIDGFHIRCAVNDKLVSIAGDNWIVQNCDAAHASGASGGPGILIQETSDVASSWTLPCTNILLQSNFVHDTFGEGIYVGGGEVVPNGYPSHSGVTIQYNTISNAGRWGGQGDGIDIKGGIYSCVIRGNEITGLTNTSGVRPIVAQGQTNAAAGTNLLIEANFIHDCAGNVGSGIGMSDTWGVPQGVVIRNNVIVKLNGTGGRDGISLTTSQDAVQIYNNLIAKNGGFGIDCTLTGVTILVTNNIVFGNNANGNQVMYRGTIGSDYNLYTNAAWGYASEGSHSFSVSPSQLLAGFVGADNYNPTPVSSAIGAGATVGGFGTDFNGALRSVPWDIGPYEYQHLAQGITNLSISVNRRLGL